MSLSTLRGISLVLVLGCCLSATLAQDDDSIYSFGGDAAFVSKYIWRGQRLTNDWSMQPSMTFGASGFSFNVWGNMDMTAVNEGDSLFLQENPLAPLGDHSDFEGQVFRGRLYLLLCPFFRSGVNRHRDHLLHLSGAFGFSSRHHGDLLRRDGRQRGPSSLGHHLHRRG